MGHKSRLALLAATFIAVTAAPSGTGWATSAASSAAGPCDGVWRPEALPATISSGFEAGALTILPTGEGWLGGTGLTGGRLLHRRPDGSWNFETLPLKTARYAVVAAQSGEAWAYDGVALARRDAAGSWTRVAAPSGLLRPQEVLTALAVSAPGDVWMTITGGFSPITPSVVHFDGRSWQRISLPDGFSASAQPALVDSSAPNNVWLAGLETFWHWDGVAWRAYSQLPGADFPFAEGLRAQADGSALFFGGGGGAAGHANAGAVQIAPSGRIAQFGPRIDQLAHWGNEEFQGIALLGSRTPVAVGVNLLTYQPRIWMLRNGRWQTRRFSQKARRSSFGSISSGVGTDGRGGVWAAATDPGDGHTIVLKACE